MKRILIFILLATIFACQRHTVTRVSPDQQIDLSGRWNDTDSKMVADAMTKDILNRPWIANFSQRNGGKKPVVIVGVISNKSHEHIEAETFIKDVEKAFVNTGMVRLVQDGTFREKVRQERADQQEFASPETQKKWGKELGADFMLFGTINSIVDSYNRKQVTLYKVNLELTDLETNEVVYLGDKEIKKYITN
jgi:hypothetical protein